ncbi:AAEL008226-PA [Aedes aegypti]|uniref:AAEL008226-PA n=1 Tax=Aedes aegypti TaxID=7159 RepID=Q16ZD4_AEDAE|nr:AAEL008226-PA [Aedes aegypti]
MKTKKQLAAAAAAAAAAADNKAATAGSSNTSNITASTSVTSTPIAIKKPVKRLQAKTKEIPSKPIDGQQSTSTVGSASGPLPKQQKQSAANPKSPVATKHDPPTPATKNVKNATAGTSAATKVKKSSPAAGGKNPSADKKKIQKELKNLGITDRAINQIDTAAINPCNPSISEMVKTKSRATVSQQKAADFGSLGSPLVGQKSVPAATNSASIENPKPSEPIAATTPTKRKPVPKAKDTKAEEGAKNKTPVTAQQSTSSAPPSSHSQPCPAKEDVKAPAVPKNTDSKKSDDKNDEEEVQSRIEDIMKSLEDDDDEEVGMGPLMIEPKIEKEEPNAKKKPPTKVAKSKSEGQKMQKAPICKVNENLDKTDKPSLLHNQPSEEPTKDSINQDTPKATTKRKNTKPRKPSVKKKPEPQCRTESPKHVKESPSDRDDFTTTLPQQTPSTSQSPSTLLNETTQCIIEPKPLEQIESPEPPKSIRSSTENDDDLPLNRLKDQSQPDKPQTFAVPQTPPSVKVIPSASKTPQSTEPVIQTPAKSKRKYVRKTPTNAGSASKKKPSKAATASAVKDPSDKKPSEKKDVYDFDESESESDAPGKAEKPVFKRKQKQTSSAKEDEQDDESLKDKPTDEAESKPNKDENEKSDGEGQVDELEKEPSKEDKLPMKVAKKPKVLLKESDSDSDQSEEDKPLRKPTKPLPKPKVVKAPIKESISDSDADESEDDKERDPDERPATPVSKKIKQEVRDSSDEDSDGYSSEESVRTRIVKKQLTAKTRHLKLYGFWSGPKRHRVASLNAIAKKVAPVKEERKKVTKKTEPKEDKKKETKKVEVKEEKKEEKKKEKEKKKEETESDSESEESEEEVVTRTLRCVPGLRGVGKHWDPNASSMESEGDVLPDSDETYAQGKDTDPVKKRKVKRKIVKKVKPKAKAEKTEKPDKPKPPAKKIKKEIKALMSDAEKQHDEDSSSSTASSEKVPIKPKSDEPKKRKREPKEKKEVVEVLGKKRMASLNATAMLAATYEVQRILYRNTDSDSDSPAEKPKAKKVKEQKEAKDKESAKADDKKSSKAAVKDSKADEEQDPLGDTDKVAQKDKPKEKEKNKDAEKDKEKEKEKDVEVLLTVKTEPMRDKKDDTTEVKRELEEPRPVSSNVVIAQDTEVTITGVYVNSSLGANQEAYCKMQYRVQQSVTEERLVRPGEAPPKSYTPLTALSSMRPPNDQALSTPPLFGQPAQCDSPLGLVGPPRGFYPPSTSSSGSSSAFCAPIPHDSPAETQ